MALDEKHASTKLELDIPKTFDKLLQKGMLHKLSNYELTVRAFSAMKLDPWM